MKNKILSIGVIFFLLIITIAPSINAQKIEKDVNIDSGKYGRVSGFVHTDGFPPYTYISGAKIVLEGGPIKRITFSGVLGFYRFNFVEIGKLYTLTATHPDYKTETKTFTLSADKPHIVINFPMDIKHTRNTKSEEQECLGSIYGYTGIGYIWGFSPVRFAKVQAGGKTTISGPIMGEYRIRGLPLGTYTVTGTKKGYDTFTDTVTLTEKHPDKQVFVHLEPNDKSVETKEKIGLFTSTKICSNTRSNFLCTFAFMS